VKAGGEHSSAHKSQQSVNENLLSCLLATTNGNQDLLSQGGSNGTNQRDLTRYVWSVYDVG